jgi:hypothetical protein
VNYFEDREIEPGEEYRYFVEALVLGGKNVLSPEVLVLSANPALMLNQNYPNPFNPATTIKYYVPEHCHVLLEIFNVSGKRVAILIDESQEKGQYSIDWNGQDQSGYPVSSGTYFYRLRAGKETIARKMVLLR